MNEKRSISEFSDVDRAGRPQSLIDYLGTVTGIESIQAYKRQSYDLLHLRSGQHVLDVGCGTGDDVRSMAGRVGTSGLAVGIDNSEVMVTEAKKRSAGLGLTVEFRTGVASALPFGDDSFHAARSDRVFQHLADPSAALREMVRVVRRGGRIGVLDTDWETIVVDSADHQLTRSILSIPHQTCLNPTSGRKLFSLFHQVGLADIEVLAITIPILNLPLSESVLGLREYVDTAIAKKAITADLGAKWLHELKQRDIANRFFSSITGFGLFGTKT